MAFGQEVGRVLSDGRIVGRAEPFAKVFPSSRAVKRAVGLAAWAILEDIALDARLDDDGRLVAETNVRRIADNLGIGKNAVSRHLARLREYGFVIHEELRDPGSGRYEVSRYVLDPSACIERFTTTPKAVAAKAPASRPQLSHEQDTDEGAAPCPSDGDTAPRPASSSSGHREQGQNSTRGVVVEEAQQPAPTTDVHYESLVDRLQAIGVSENVAAALVAGHASEQIADALEATAGQPDLRNAAGWVVRAVRDGWDLSRGLAEQRAGEQRRHAEAARAAAAAAARNAEAEQRERADGWADAVSAALGDDDLRRALKQVTTPAAGLGRPSVPLARAQLVAWAVKASQQAGDRPLPDALSAALTGAHAAPLAMVDEALPEPPAYPSPTAGLNERIRQAWQPTQ
jgi:DNA-binding transcriptional ArsR family regulator